MADSVERKLTTILCADVHGYTRLMEQDEAATLATLRLYREAIDGLVARHHGRIVSTAGDSCSPTSRAWSRRCNARSRSSRSWPGATARCRMRAAWRSGSASTSAT